MIQLPLRIRRSIQVDACTYCCASIYLYCGGYFSQSPLLVTYQTIAINVTMGANHGVEYHLTFNGMALYSVLMSAFALVGGVLYICLSRSLNKYTDVTPFTQRFDGRHLFEELMV